MKKIFLFLIILVGLSGCKYPTEFPLYDSFKPADEFARQFINNIITGQLDSCFTKIDKEILNDTTKDYITNASHNLHGRILKKYKIVEEIGSAGLSPLLGPTNENIYYKLGYEYEFEKGCILFRITISKKNGIFSVESFDGQILSAPLAELTKFSLADKPVKQYVFVIIAILTPFFILTTLIIMLFSKITNKKKIIWSLIILLISLPRFIINWGNGQMDIHLFMFGIPGAGFYRTTLYSDWLLYFNFPIGAIIYLVKRRSLLPKIINEE